MYYLLIASRGGTGYLWLQHLRRGGKRSGPQDSLSYPASSATQRAPLPSKAEGPPWPHQTTFQIQNQNQNPLQMHVFFISGIFLIIFSNPDWPQATKNSEVKTRICNSDYVTNPGDHSHLRDNKRTAVANKYAFPNQMQVFLLAQQVSSYLPRLSAHFTDEETEA